MVDAKGLEEEEKLIFFSPPSNSFHRHYDSFYPKDGNPLVPDLTKNVGSLPLGMTVAESVFSAGNGLAPKFVGTPVPLSSAPARTEFPARAAPADGSVDGGAFYEPIPGPGDVSDYSVRPRQ